MAKGKNGDSPYFVVTRNLTGNCGYFGILGDYGALIPALKFHNVPLSKQDQLVRMKYIQRLTGNVTPVDCRCGIQFDSEESRQSHIDKRHLQKVANIKDFNECSEEERAALLHAVGEPGLGPRDPEYYTTQYDFQVPDPDDRHAAQQDRELEQSIDWTQTAASKK